MCGHAVDGRVPVEQVRGPAVQAAADHVGAVALGLVEGDAGVEERAEQPVPRRSPGTTATSPDAAPEVATR